MGDTVGKVILCGFDAAQFNSRTGTQGYRVVAGGRSYPALRVWKTGFALSADDAPLPRGLVELYRGQEYVLMGLVVANAPENNEIVFEFKRATHVTDQPPLDFVAPSSVARDALVQDGLTY